MKHIHAYMAIMLCLVISIAFGYDASREKKPNPDGSNWKVGPDILHNINLDGRNDIPEYTIDYCIKNYNEYLSSGKQISIYIIYGSVYRNSMSDANVLTGYTLYVCDSMDLKTHYWCKHSSAMLFAIPNEKNRSFYNKFKRFNSAVKTGLVTGTLKEFKVVDYAKRETIYLVLLIDKY